MIGPILSMAGVFIVLVAVCWAIGANDVNAWRPTILASIGFLVTVLATFFY